MYEVLMLLWLTRKNAKDAVHHGRSPGSAKAYTIILWFGCAITGAAICAVAFRIGPGISGHLLYIALAWLAVGSFGGLLSRLIARRK